MDKQLLTLDLQHFSERKKNALTEHYIAPVPENGSEPNYMRLAKWVHTIEPDSDEETDDTAYYDGDGTPETDVISVKKTWAAEGSYLDSDPAHKFLRSIENKSGEHRKGMYKQVRQNGDVLEGPATFTDVITTGGEASDFEPLQVTINWDREPKLTQNGNNGDNGGDNPEEED